ncbi:NAD(P)/FAD-dependent oxidoreductase [Amycolatopsis sp. FDAARGOS 1241]|uniref:NAD(P)/FAD-dependent oxidoreductase n=1 Tax=Amycolatopsis sp. FDAARGOS 1241 TaxID=2778070 RepID=UPI00194DEE73|nr:NAD(P)/FAD-dependent oxidoreductase [Amycolatopsis sp. FDAARGOS 1241]QRP49313.1 NAD(P)/FAD-dependent oxidoreductase [Amycolatopsis sp. FDAARGOS 1241]
MRVVIVGGGFAGYNAAKRLLKTAGDDIEVVVVNPTDYFLYLPLLPEVSAGLLDPRSITISIPATLPGVRLALGTVSGVDFGARTVTYTDPEDHTRHLSYDRLVLAAGSVNRLLPIPGVAENAHGFRGVPEALYLRDHITRQIELAAAATDPQERAARCTFVVVGAGYTGTEVAAQGPAFTDALAERHPELKGQPVRWLLLDIADRVLPELSKHLAKTADTVLRERGVEVLMKTSVKEATPDGVTLTSGDRVSTRTLVWCVGVRPDPLVADLGLPTAKDRIVVTTELGVPGYPEVFACGDAAAVPDLTRPGEYTAMTAQHAERQGKLAGQNVAASLGYGQAGTYRHHDLGFVVDLGAGHAAANPLHLPLSGFPAKVVTRGYHLLAMPGNRLRTAIGWALATVSKRPTVQLGLVRGPSVPLNTDSPELPHRR